MCFIILLHYITMRQTFQVFFLPRSYWHKKSVPLRTSKSEVSYAVGRMWDEGLTVLLLKSQGFWDVMQCHWARGYRNAFECRAPLNWWQCVTSQQNWIFAAGVAQDSESLATLRVIKVLAERAFNFYNFLSCEENMTEAQQLPTSIFTKWVEKLSEITFRNLKYFPAK